MWKTLLFPVYRSIEKVHKQHFSPIFLQTLHLLTSYRQPSLPRSLLVAIDISTAEEEEEYKINRFFFSY